MMTLYKQMKDKKQFKELLLKVRTLCKEQNEHYYNLFLKPNDDTVSLIDKVLKNEVTLEQFKHSKEKIIKHREKVTKLLKGG